MHDVVSLPEIDTGGFDAFQHGFRLYVFSHRRSFLKIETDSKSIPCGLEYGPFCSGNRFWRWRVRTTGAAIVLEQVPAHQVFDLIGCGFFPQAVVSRPDDEIAENIAQQSLQTVHLFLRNLRLPDYIVIEGTIIV